MKNQMIILATLLMCAPAVSAKLVKESEFTVQTPVKVIQLSLEAKCRAPRFEDDGFTVWYSPESFAEISKYRGYSSKVMGRTCGSTNSRTELSGTEYEKVDVLLYNYGEARSSFDDQIRQLIQGF